MTSKELTEVCKEIEAQNPDVLVLGGDLVDEGTSIEELNDAIAILGDIESTYGTFYVYGNHDLSNYSTNPNYTKEQLEDALRKANIHIFGEESYQVTDDFTIVGRLDYSLLEDKSKKMLYLTRKHPVVVHLGLSLLFH